MSDSVRREVHLDCVPDEAWALVSEAEHLGAWFADAVRIDLREGGEAVFAWSDGSVRRAVIEEVRPPEVLAFRWDAPAGGGEAGAAVSGRVEVRVEADGAGTRIVVTETGAEAGLAPLTACIGFRPDARLSAAGSSRALAAV